MPDLPTRSGHPVLAIRLYRRWARMTDWLGARRPLDLCLGLLVATTAVLGLAHLF